MADASPSGISARHSPQDSRLTVVVPSLRDDRALAGLLSDLGEQEAAPEQVIVADGAASEDTAALCRRWAAVSVRSPPGRGVQLAAGVTAARRAWGAPCGAVTDILWFLHADCRPHPGAARRIRAAVAGGAAGGYLRFRFGGEATAVKRMLERAVALRCRFGAVYGDQGVFATRAAYEAGPGFDAQPLFEEVPLVRALRRTGRFVALDVPITIDPRRWERDGFVRRTLYNRLLAAGYLLGISPARLAFWYRGSR